MTRLTALVRGVGRASLATMLTLGTAGALLVAGVGVATTMSAIPDGASPTSRPTRPFDSAITVAVVLGASGTDIADALAPFEVFASSSAMSAYTIAASAAPASLGSGLAIVPDHTFAEVADGIVKWPDLVVVPAVERPDGAEEQAARDFITAAYQGGARVLGVCAGARLLAASGVLDGHRATSHWSRLGALRGSRPQVRWADGVRYVQDGRITTTAGVSSGIPGALRVLADLAGPDEAARVGRLIDYPGWRPDQSTTIGTQGFGAADVGVLGNLVLPWGRPTIDVRLDNGVGEIDAAALLEVYGYSQAVNATAVSEAGTVVTRHGLTLRTTLAAASGERPAVVAADIRSDAGHAGFDAAFEQLGRDSSPGTVRSVAKMLEYPLDRVAPQPTSVVAAWRTPLLLTVVAALAIGMGSVPYLLRRRRPTAARGVNADGPARPSGAASASNVGESPLDKRFHRH